MRAGIGWDIHKTTPDRPLVLGGVRIPDAPGLLAHSDGDVLVHAIVDALIGAAGLGDIGNHFPDTDPALKGISGAAIAARVLQLLGGKGLRIVNVDCTVILERPRLEPHKAAIQASLARLFDLPPGDVNVKAKTYEKLGAVGRGEAIEAHAVVLLRRVHAEEPTPAKGAKSAAAARAAKSGAKGAAPAAKSSARKPAKPAPSAKAKKAPPAKATSRRGTTKRR